MILRLSMMDDHGAASIGWCDRPAAVMVGAFNLREESKREQLPPRKKVERKIVRSDTERRVALLGGMCGNSHLKEPKAAPHQSFIPMASCINSGSSASICCWSWLLSAVAS